MVGGGGGGGGGGGRSRPPTLSELETASEWKGTLKSPGRDERSGCVDETIEVFGNFLLRGERTRHGLLGPDNEIKVCGGSAS